VIVIEENPGFLSLATAAIEPVGNANEGLRTRTITRSKTLEMIVDSSFLFLFHQLFNFASLEGRNTSKQRG